MFPKWLLPDYLEDLLPAEAARVELARNELVDTMVSYGYQLVSPPLLEHVDSLLTGSGQDLDLQTFKIVDQLSGRTLGIRSDVTSQIARIDAHVLACSEVTRLCYAERVLRTRPHDVDSSREIFQLGAELFGADALDADIEITSLMVDCIKKISTRPLTLDLGNVSIVMAVFDWLNLGSQDRSDFFSALQAKDTAYLDTMSSSLSSQKRKVVMELPKLYGDVAILNIARDLLSDVPGALSGIGELENIAKELDGSVAQVSFDLAEMRGFHYHSGIVTAAYIDGEVSPVSRGGRYDHVGEVFGRSRKATGFTIDLRRLARLGSDEIFVPKGRLISAPRISHDAELMKLIKSLREQGDVVIVDLNLEGSETADSSATHRLERIDGTWQVVSL